MNANPTYTEAREAVWTKVAYIDGAETVRAFDVVVFQIDQFTPSRPHRTIVLRMNMLDKNFDRARLQRLYRRLRNIGIGFNTPAPSDCRGTVFAHSRAAFA
ncbi:MAG: hypothetical protein ACTHKE_03485 [Sphingomicrobium sp.]